MRLKNVKGAKEIIEASSYIIKEPERFKGNYKRFYCYWKVRERFKSSNDNMG